MLSIPGSDAAPDVEVGAEALRLSRDLDPDFLFVNLGDVDRVGHVDVSGGLLDAVAPDGTQPLVQAAALASADLQLRLVVEELRASGRWASTVFLVTADHSMDWSFVDRQLDLAPAFEADELLAGEVVTAVNGGACLYALRAPDEPQADERLRRMREIALATDGVERALYLRPNPLDGGDAHTVQRTHPDWGLGGDYTGDLIVTVQQGYRIGHGGPASNPIPGNHGHEVTLRIPMIVSGGWDGLVTQQVVAPEGPTALTDRPANQGENIDVAPTVAWLLGLNPPPGGFDGRVLTEAFSRRPSPRVAVANVASVPLFDRLGPDGAIAASVALSREAFPDGGASPATGEVPLLTGDEAVLDQVLPAPTGGGGSTVLIGPADAPDRLVAAGPLGAALGAPLLLTTADRLPDAVAAEVRRLAADRAIVLGGTDVVTEQVVETLRDAGVGTVDRFDGDAAEVAAAAAREMGVPDDAREVALVAGAADAAAAQGLAIRRARPVLVANSLPAATAEVLDDLAIDRVLAVGDALDAATVETLRSDGRLVEPVTARDGRDLPRRLAERAVREGALTDDLYLATDAATALAAAPAVAQLRGSLLLIPAGGAVASFVTDRADEFVRVRFLGDVPDGTRRAIESAITARRARGATTAPAPAPEPPTATDARPVAPAPAAPARDDRGPLPVTGATTGLLGLGALGVAAALRARMRSTDADV